SYLSAMRTLLVFLLCFCFSCSFGQGLNNLWMMGYDNGFPIPYGGTDIDFNTGVANIYYKYRSMNFKRTAANITDAQGNLRFSTNGVYIADSTGEQMLNGDSLNPGTWTQQHAQYGDGLALPQAA